MFLHLLLTCSLVGFAQVASGPGDRCLMLDSCYFKTDTKSCSCRPDCRLYGICCLGAKGGPDPDPPAFQCYGRRTQHALFVLRSCKPDYRGHPDDGATCVDDDEDGADVVNNLLVTNRLTQVTYWNKQCAKCNEENWSNLVFWDIVVRCEARKGVDAGFVRKHLTYDPGRLRWGLKVGEGPFLPCTLHYAPPDSLQEVKYCTPNVIQTCPPDFPDQDRARKCSQAYAERKLKNGDVYFRNVHCAICNGYDEKEVECTGMLAGPEEDAADDSDFRDVTEVVFSGGDWLHKEAGRMFECSPGYVYDPFRGRCRTSLTERDGDVLLNSAPMHCGMSYLLLATLSVALLL